MLAAAFVLAASPALAASLLTVSADLSFQLGLSADGNWFVYSATDPHGLTFPRPTTTSIVGPSGTETIAGSVTGISAAGNVIIGIDDAGLGYVRQDGVVSYLAAGAASPNAVSRDGTVVVGNSNGHAFSWSGGTFTDLGVLNGANTSNATVISGDGRVIAGDSHVGGFDVAVMWADGATTPTALGSLGGTGSYAFAISNDGTTIVGRGDVDGQSHNHAYRWNSGNMVDLGTLGGIFSEAWAVSADGSVVAGGADIAGDVTHAFRWTDAGMVDLGSLGGQTNRSEAYAMSDDGAVVVGYTDSDAGGTGFRWDATDGMEAIGDYLGQAGLDVSGWRFDDVRTISADGLAMAGTGTDGTHFAGVWYARCDSVTYCDLISSGDVGDSLASLGALGSGPNGALEGDFAALGNALKHAGPGASASIYGGYDSDPAASAGVVVTMKPSDALVAALGVGTSHLTTSLALGGSATFDAATLSVALGLMPDQGFTAQVAVSAAGLAGRVTRGYLNGNTPAQSQGDTTGGSLGLDALLGWRFADVAPGTSLLAYGGLDLARTAYAGWTESGGPFPASIDGFTVDTATVRAGLEATHAFGAATATGRVALVHQASAGSPVAGTIIGAFGSSVDLAFAATDWLELGGGLSLPAGALGTSNLDVTVRVPTAGPASVTAQAGFQLPL